MERSNAGLKPKLCQACERCRTLKAKCIPSSVDGLCQKCHKAGAKCFFGEQKQPRRRLGRSSKARMTVLESKLDALLAQVGSKPDEPTPNISPTPPETIPLPPSKTESFSPSVSGYHSDGLIENLTKRGIISAEKAVLLLESFRKMVSHFPFVLIPPDASVQSMALDRPFLLLAAICTASAAEDRNVTQTLEKELRTSLCSKVLFDGEKSLDLLQGLLVYLAWYHFYYVPQKQQSYQLLQMAIGMAVDLGLDQKPCDALVKKPGFELSHYWNQPDESRCDDFYGAEARRAFLGCYYLSSMSTIVWKKPNHLRYSHYMAQCRESLARECLVPSDKVLVELIQLQHLAEEGAEALQVWGSEKQTEMSQLRIQSQIKTIDAELEKWRSSLGHELENCTLLKNAYHFAIMYVHENDLLLPRLRKHSLPDSNVPFSRQAFYENLLFSCLESSRSLFENFLSIPRTDYYRLTFGEWEYLIIATVVLYRLSLGVPRVPSWDVHVARNSAKLEQYLEQIKSTMEFVQSAIVGGEDDNNLFLAFGSIFESVVTKYTYLKSLPPFEKQDSLELPHPSGAVLGQGGYSKAMKAGRCPASPYWAMRSPEVPSSELWLSDFNPHNETNTVNSEGDYDLWGQMLQNAETEFGTFG